MQTQSDINLIRQKQSERVVDVILDRLNHYAELDSPGVTDEVHEELTNLVQRVLSPEFEEHRDDFDSSNVACIAYDKESAVLQVDFQSGGRYHYFGVEQDKAKLMFESASKGSYLSSQIKPAYPHAKVS